MRIFLCYLFAEVFQFYRFYGWFYFSPSEEVTQAGEAEEWGSEESIEEDIEDAGAQNMSSDEDFVLDDEENEKNKGASTEQASNSGENSDNKGNAETQSVLPLKRKADDANIAEGSEQTAATSTCVDGDDDSCSIAIQTTPPKLKKKRRSEELEMWKRPTMSKIAHQAPK